MPCMRQAAQAGPDALRGLLSTVLTGEAAVWRADLDDEIDFTIFQAAFLERFGSMVRFKRQEARQAATSPLTCAQHSNWPCILCYMPGHSAIQSPCAARACDEFVPGCCTPGVPLELKGCDMQQEHTVAHVQPRNAGGSSVGSGYTCRSPWARNSTCAPRRAPSGPPEHVAPLQHLQMQSVMAAHARLATNREHIHWTDGPTLDQISCGGAAAQLHTSSM